MSAALIVIAKAPVAGRSKTRLCPPCTPAEAAKLAEAALADTLAAAVAMPVRRVLALDGEPGPWLPPGFELLPQRGDGLGERLGNAFAAVGGPAVVVGMDTPQVTPALLGDAVGALGRTDVDALLGSAPDGGYWALGLRRADASVFAGVPMSCAGTAAAQRRRLAELGLRVGSLPPLRDVDTIEDARLVAAGAPETRFARAVARLGYAGSAAA